MVESGVEMNETAGHSARGRSHRYRRFARLGEIGIGMNDGRAHKANRDQNPDRAYPTLNRRAARHEPVIMEQPCAVKHEKGCKFVSQLSHFPKLSGLLVA